MGLPNSSRSKHAGEPPNPHHATGGKREPPKSTPEPTTTPHHHRGGGKQPTTTQGVERIKRGLEDSDLALEGSKVPAKCVQNLLGHDVAWQGRSLQAQLCWIPLERCYAVHAVKTVVKTAADVESLDPDCRCHYQKPLEWCGVVQFLKSVLALKDPVLEVTHGIDFFLKSGLALRTFSFAKRKSEFF